MKCSAEIKENRDFGYSLVELIVVISIMAIMTGLLSVGISLMFSRDAESVAKTIDDELTEVRMLSMSRDGNYELVINIDASTPSNNSVDIKKDGSVFKNVKMKKNASITVSGGGLASTVTNGTVSIVFDKGNGSVKTINTNPSSGVCEILATSTRLSSKSSTVNLVTTTGRHYLTK